MFGWKARSARQRLERRALRSVFARRAGDAGRPVASSTRRASATPPNGAHARCCSGRRAGRCTSTASQRRAVVVLALATSLTVGVAVAPLKAQDGASAEAASDATARGAQRPDEARPAVGDVSVAFVNIARIIDDSPQSAAAMRELEREFGPRDAELVAEREALARLRERLEQASSERLPPEVIADLEREFTTRSRELRRAQESFTEDLNLRRNEELARLQRRVNEAIVRLARERGIDLVVTERNVLYTSERIDLTDEVIRAMDR